MQYKARMAIAYDFDETLAKENMMKYAFPALKVSKEQFFDRMVELAKTYKGDYLIICLYLLVELANKAGTPITKELLRTYGKQVELFPGLPEWFDRTKEYAAQQDILLDHYVISSNLREIIEGTPVAQYFTRIYGSAFIYDENDHACWPAISLDYTGKTQFLFRISKGAYEEYDTVGVHKRLSHEEKAVPFSNIIFIGDGETDIPSMEVTRTKGGHAYAVYNPDKPETVERALELAKKNRVHRALVADYSAGAALDVEIKAIIDKVAKADG